MGGYKARYGFEPRTVQSLYEYYWRRGGMGVMDHGWESFDDFVKWCSVSGYRKNYHLNRLDPTNPHGPENSFWDRTLLERTELLTFKSARNAAITAKNRSRTASRRITT